jgi:hypothetical protein
MRAMKPKNVYLMLCVAGAVIPYMKFVPWTMEHGLNLPLIIQELFSTRIGAFFGLDVIVSAVVVFAFVVLERRRMKAWWAPIVAALVVGVSCALPLALYLRVEESRAGITDYDTAGATSAARFGRCRNTNAATTGIAISRMLLIGCWL